MSPPSPSAISQLFLPFSSSRDLSGKFLIVLIFWKITNKFLLISVISSAKGVVIEIRHKILPSTTRFSSLNSIRVPDSDIGSYFGMLLDNREGSDIVFNVAGEKFHAHKLVLAARSPTLRSELFEGLDSDEQEITVSDTEPEVFKAILHFIYRDGLVEDELIASSSCSSPLVTDTLTAKLLAAADHYGLGRLRQM